MRHFRDESNGNERVQEQRGWLPSIRAIESHPTSVAPRSMSAGAVRAPRRRVWDAREWMPSQQSSQRPKKRQAEATPLPDESNHENTNLRIWVKRDLPVVLGMVAIYLFAVLF